MSFIPNTTPTPNWLYNGEMKKMNETELKVVLLVTRKTLGWFDPMTSERKVQDNISQSQFMEFTGKSHTAIAQAIQSSVEQGWIIARDRQGNLCDTSNKRRRRKIWYQLGSIFTSKISKQQSGQDENLSNISTKSKQHNASNLSNKVDNTKETITKETIQNTADKPQEFVLEEKLKQMEDNEKREDLQIVASFIRAKKLKPNSSPELTSIIKRHLRAAKQLVPFSTEQLVEAKQKAERMCGSEYTLETILKYLTK